MVKNKPKFLFFIFSLYNDLLNSYFLGDFKYLHRINLVFIIIQISITFLVFTVCDFVSGNDIWDNSKLVVPSNITTNFVTNITLHRSIPRPITIFDNRHPISPVPTYRIIAIFTCYVLAWIIDNGIVNKVWLFFSVYIFSSGQY